MDVTNFLRSDVIETLIDQLAYEHMQVLGDMEPHNWLLLNTSFRAGCIAVFRFIAEELAEEKRIS